MTASNQIFLVMDAGSPVAAFTVKREMQIYLRRWVWGAKWWSAGFAVDNRGLGHSANTRDRSEGRCCATIKNRPLATISHTPHGRASSPKGSTVKPAAAGGGGQIGQALRAISSVSIID